MSLEIELPDATIVSPTIYAENAIQTLLGIKLADDEFIDEVVEHDIGLLKIFVVVMQFNRLVTIEVPTTVDVKAMSFEQIEAAIDANRGDFTPDTVRTLNLYDTLVA